MWSHRDSTIERKSFESISKRKFQSGGRFLTGIARRNSRNGIILDLSSRDGIKLRNEINNEGTVEWVVRLIVLDIREINDCSYLRNNMLWVNTNIYRITVVSVTTTSQTPFRVNLPSQSNIETHINSIELTRGFN